MDELIFETDSKFKQATYDNASECWTFVFDKNIAVGTSGFWRLLENGAIRLVSFDHGHSFGLPKPVDLGALVENIFFERSLVEIKISKQTADLVLTLEGGFKLEIFISSTGYETYDFVIDKTRYIGMGGGDISIMDCN